MSPERKTESRKLSGLNIKCTVRWYKSQPTFHKFKEVQTWLGFDESVPENHRGTYEFGMLDVAEQERQTMRILCCQQIVDFFKKKNRFVFLFYGTRIILATLITVGFWSVFFADVFVSRYIYLLFRMFLLLCAFFVHLFQYRSSDSKIKNVDQSNC